MKEWPLRVFRTGSLRGPKIGLRGKGKRKDRTEKKVDQTEEGGEKIMLVQWGARKFHYAGVSSYKYGGRPGGSFIG